MSFSVGSTQASAPAAPQGGGSSSGGAASAPSSSPAQTSSAPAPSQSGGSQPPVTGASSPAAQNPAGTPSEGQVPPTWAPSFKFKAAGKEHEIPEWLRGVVKDADTEKQLKELHEKAYGLDLVKNNYQSAQSELQQVKTQVLPQYEKLKGLVNEVVTFRNAGDLDSVFETLNISPQKVAAWMKHKLDLQENPQLANEYNQRRDQQKQAYTLQQQNQQLMQQHQQIMLQTKQAQLQGALSKPEVLTVAESFNTRMGKPDAFWDFVCTQADTMEKFSGKPVTAEQAVMEALRILGNPIVPSGQNPGQGQMGAQAPAQGQASPTPPVIPNVGGRNTSPTKKLPRSVDDLRKLYKDGQGKTG